MDELNRLTYSRPYNQIKADTINQVLQTIKSTESIILCELK